MRISAPQKAVLIALYAIALRQGDNHPVPLMVLFNAVNSERMRKNERPVADRNFRTSCHTMVGHGLLHKFRDKQNLQLLFSLTPAGAETARTLYLQFLSESSADGVE